MRVHTDTSSQIPSKLTHLNHRKRDRQNINGYQVGAVITGMGFAGLCYSLFFLNLPNWAFFEAICGYSVTLVTTVLGWLMCMTLDPGDPGVRNDHNPSKKTSAASLQFCTLCKTRVMKNSKHCRTCKRCVLNYDHHCVWLNGCIGSANYRWFILLIWSIEILVFIQLFTTGTLLIRLFETAVGRTNLMSEYDFGDQGYCFLTAVIVTAILSVILLFSNGLLVGFHCYLQWTNQTTYSYYVSMKATRKIHPTTDYLQTQKPTTDSVVVPSTLVTKRAPHTIQQDLENSVLYPNEDSSEGNIHS